MIGIALSQGSIAGPWFSQCEYCDLTAPEAFRRASGPYGTHTDPFVNTCYFLSKTPSETPTIHLYGEGEVVDAQYAGCCEGDSFEYCGGEDETPEVTMADIHARYEVMDGSLFVQFLDGRHGQKGTFPFDVTVREPGMYLDQPGRSFGDKPITPSPSNPIPVRGRVIRIVAEIEVINPNYPKS